MISRKNPRSSACVSSSFSSTPSIAGFSLIAVGPLRTDHVVHVVVGGDRFARVAPETFEHVALHEPLLDVPVVHVGDRERAAARPLARAQALRPAEAGAIHAG